MKMLASLTASRVRLAANRPQAKESHGGIAST
jgi:hypothetical protein